MEVFVGLGIWLTMFLAIAIPLSCWTDRTLEFWLTHFSGHTVHVPFWIDFLITLVANGVMFALNIISELARLVIGQ